MRRYPDRAVEALLTEYRALFFNPRSKMFGRYSLHERLVEDGNLIALQRFEQQLDQAQWSVYELRRLFFARKGDPTCKGPGWRSTRKRYTGTRAQAQRWMNTYVGTDTDSSGRLWIRGQTPAPGYPRVEHFIGISLAGTIDKERPSFAKHWAAVTGEKLFDLTDWEYQQ